MKNLIILFITSLFFSEIYGQSEVVKKQTELTYVGNYIDGKIQLSYKFQDPKIDLFDEKGIIVSSTFFKDTLEGEIKYRMIFLYDKAGKLVLTNYEDRDGIILRKIKKSYTKQGNLLLEEEYDLETGKLSAQIKYSYDKNNFLLKKVEKIADGNTFITRNIITYLKDNKIQIEEKYTSGKRVISHNVSNYENKVKTHTLDILNSESTFYEYYPTGKLMLEKWFSVEKEKVFRYFYEYDSKGNVTVQVFTLGNTSATITQMTYEYWNDK